MQDVTDHSRMEVLSSAECFELLSTVPIGRLAYVADGAPQIFPIAFGVHGSRIVFRSSTGSKLDAAAMRRQVAFEADTWDPVTRSGWSVVVQGMARHATDADELARLDFEPWLAGENMEWVEILVEDISGRRLPG